MKRKQLIERYIELKTLQEKNEKYMQLLEQGFLRRLAGMANQVLSRSATGSTTSADLEQEASDALTKEMNSFLQKVKANGAALKAYIKPEPTFDNMPVTPSAVGKPDPLDLYVNSVARLVFWGKMKGVLKKDSPTFNPEIQDKITFYASTAYNLLKDINSSVQKATLYLANALKDTGIDAEVKTGKIQLDRDVKTTGAGAPRELGRVTGGGAARQALGQAGAVGGVRLESKSKTTNTPSLKKLYEADFKKN